LYVQFEIVVRVLNCQNNSGIVCGRRSELQKSERQKTQRTSKMHVRIRTPKVSIKVIRTPKVEINQNSESLPMMYYLWIPRPVGVSLGSIRLG
jgi:hypothetical protein